MKLYETMALKGSSFYVILPSNTAVDGNKTNSFRVRLPRKLEFGSEWQVGLAVLVYPRSWPSLGTSASQFLKIKWKTQEEIKIEIPAGSFKTPLELLQALDTLLHNSSRHDLIRLLEYYRKIIAQLEIDTNRKIDREIDILTQKSNDSSASLDIVPKLSEKTRNRYYMEFFTQGLLTALPDVKERTFIQAMKFTTPQAIDPWIHAYNKVRNCCKFSYSEQLQKFSASINSDYIEAVELSEQLAYIMGFDKQRLLTSESAKFIPDMTGGVSSFNVYAPGLIEPVMVGDVTTPLLRMVNIHSGVNEEIVEENYFAIQYHKLLVRDVSEIYIEIRTSSGTLMPFQYGTCSLTLHFKKASYF